MRRSKSLVNLYPSQSLGTGTQEENPVIGNAGKDGRIWMSQKNVDTFYTDKNDLSIVIYYGSMVN